MPFLATTSIRRVFGPTRWQPITASLTPLDRSDTTRNLRLSSLPSFASAQMLFGNDEIKRVAASARIFLRVRNTLSTEGHEGNEDGEPS
jgi:hypothetical protein